MLQTQYYFLLKKKIFTKDCRVVIKRNMLSRAKYSLKICSTNHETKQTYAGKVNELLGEIRSWDDTLEQVNIQFQRPEHVQTGRTMSTSFNPVFT